MFVQQYKLETGSCTLVCLSDILNLIVETAKLKKIIDKFMDTFIIKVQ